MTASAGFFDLLLHPNPLIGSDPMHQELEEFQQRLRPLTVEQPQEPEEQAQPAAAEAPRQPNEPPRLLQAADYAAQERAQARPLTVISAHRHLLDACANAHPGCRVVLYQKGELSKVLENLERGPALVLAVDTTSESRVGGPDGRYREEIRQLEALSWPNLYLLAFDGAGIDRSDLIIQDMTFFRDCFSVQSSNIAQLSAFLSRFFSRQ